MPTVSPTFLLLLLVAVGGAVGGVCRYWLMEAVARRAGVAFPWGTLMVNVTGCLAAGALWAALTAMDDGSGAGTSLWAGLGIGLVGSYTTVSSFSLQTVSLFHGGARRAAVLNVLASMSLCLGAVVAGYLAVGRLMGG